MRLATLVNRFELCQSIEGSYLGGVRNIHESWLYLVWIICIAGGKIGDALRGNFTVCCWG